MKKETWFVDTNDKVIMPSDLNKDPDRYGGMSMHMVSAYNNGVITIPIHDNYGCHVSIQVTDTCAADRIIYDGKIDIISSGYWSSIQSDNIKIMYHNTNDSIPIWRGGIFV